MHHQMSHQKSLDEALTILNSFKYLGESKSSNGAHLIGRTPHIAPEAWLHIIYPPLTDNDISNLANQLSMPIPKSYEAFLRKTNGLNIFNTTLSLYGLRDNYNRKAGSIRQPFDISTPNKLERPSNAQSTFFFFGSYDWDGSLLYLDSRSEKVFLCENEDATPLYEWKNLVEMILFEIRRISTLFDKNGKQIDEDCSTLPTDY